MRYQGRITAWNDDRGFGFVECSDGRHKAFLHISALQDRRRRPSVGELISYDLVWDAKGRSQATNVAFPGSVGRDNRHMPDRRMAWGYHLAIVGAIVALGASAYVMYKTTQSSQVAPDGSAVFACEGKTRCSQMTSCAEAMFYLKNCPGQQTDGDGDRVPCESQWCGH